MLALTLPWFGGLLHTMYLQARFGVPSDAIHVSVYSSYAASLKPVGLALGLAAVVLALAGHGGPSEHLWMRGPLDGHRHRRRRPSVSLTRSGCLRAQR
ncbi:hypothetical protein AB0C45_28340 [Streptomyces cyaneofuscatus]|uniref:hypothetical protein n=1 Tax=Streptomyces cyaneofuscatus TaxID=66883 RepID=UPI0033D8F48C